jgi:ADP-heptose:LPS heptosyltransferase
MNRLKDLVYELIGWLAAKGRRKPSASKKLLIIRVDEIGDFMLWRPFLQTLIRLPAYHGYEFHFCGNQSWKSLFDTFDADTVQQSFWIDKSRFKKKIGYRYRFLREIYQQQYDVVINPTFSRDKRYDDSIVKASKAYTRIGMEANLENTRQYETGYDKGLYTILSDKLPVPAFEFFTNLHFIENISLAFLSDPPSDIPFLPKDTKVNFSLLPAPVALPEEYFVIFPGSRSKTRIWPAENFKQVSDYLFQTKQWTAVVAGSAADKEYADVFINTYKGPVINLTGKTSLTDTLSLLKNAQCLLTVDTGSVHLAAAVGCTVFGIFNGSQYGRFAPYPSEIAENIYPVYPEEIVSELQNPELVKTKYQYVVQVPYSLVTPQKLIAVIQQHYVSLPSKSN